MQLATNLKPMTYVSQARTNDITFQKDDADQTILLNPVNLQKLVLLYYFLRYQE